MADNRLSVLIVEDDSIIAWHLGIMVSRLGHEVCATAATEEAALVAATSHAPDIVLMDVRLAGGGDGVRAAEAIRAVRSVPIIFCTAHADDAAFQARTAAIPLSSILGKPVLEQELRAAIDGVVVPRR